MSENIISDKVAGAICSEKLMNQLKKCSNFTKEDEEKLASLYNVDSKNGVYINEYGIVYGAVQFPKDWSDGMIWDWYWSAYEEDKKEYPDYQLGMVRGEFPLSMKTDDSSESQIGWSNYIVVIGNPEKLFGIEKKASPKKRKEMIQTALLGVDAEFINFDCSLPGAIGTKSEFTFLNSTSYMDDFGDGAELCQIADKNHFREDTENGIFVNESGAVLNAYDFSELTEEDKQEVIGMIKNDYHQKYPSYELVVEPGVFPLSLADYSPLAGCRFHKSTHVLYAKNYEQCLVPKEEKSSSHK